MEQFINNKYTSIYWQIIRRGQIRQTNYPINGYSECHHIIPKSMGGDNSKDNLVELTAREHFICHRLLIKMTTGKARRSMAYALHIMSCGKHKFRLKLTSQMYGYIREEYSKSVKENWNNDPQRKANLSKRMKHMWTDPAFRERMSLQSKRLANDPIRKKELSDQMKEWWNSLTEDEYAQECAKRKEIGNRPEIIAKRIHCGPLNGMFGKTHTDEVKQRLSEANKRRFKDKTYDEIYGDEKAEQLKQQRRQQMVDRRKHESWTGSSNPNAKRVVVKGKEFATSSEAALYFNKSRPTISQWLRKYEDCYVIEELR